MPTQANAEHDPQYQQEVASCCTPLDLLILKKTETYG